MTVEVTRQDIEAQWRPLTEAEAATVPGRAASAWLRIRAAVPSIEASLAAAPPLVGEDVVKDVMVSMLLRVFKNPDGARSVSDAIDDHTETRTIDAVLSSGELYLTPAELAMLQPPAVAPVTGMYVIGLGG